VQWPQTADLTQICAVAPDCWSDTDMCSGPRLLFWHRYVQHFTQTL